MSIVNRNRHELHVFVIIRNKVGLLCQLDLFARIAYRSFYLSVLKVKVELIGKVSSVLLRLLLLIFTVLFTNFDQVLFRKIVR